MAADEEKTASTRTPVQVLDLLETQAMIPLIAQAHAATRMVELEAIVRRRRDALLAAYHQAGRTYAELARPVGMKAEGVSRAIDRFRAHEGTADEEPAAGAPAGAPTDTTDDRALEVAALLLGEVQRLRREETQVRDNLIVELHAANHRISKMAAAIGLSEARVATVIEQHGQRVTVR